MYLRIENVFDWFFFKNFKYLKVSFMVAIQKLKLEKHFKKLFRGRIDLFDQIAISF